MARAFGLQAAEVPGAAPVACTATAAPGVAADCTGEAAPGAAAEDCTGEAAPGAVAEDCTGQATVVGATAVVAERGTAQATGVETGTADGRHPVHAIKFCMLNFNLQARARLHCMTQPQSL